MYTVKGGVGCTLTSVLWGCTGCVHCTGGCTVLCCTEGSVLGVRGWRRRGRRDIALANISQTNLWVAQGGGPLEGARGASSECSSGA